MTSRRLAITLATLALLASCARPAPLPAPATAGPFEPEIQRFEAADRAAMPATGGVVFVGSSTFRFWATMTADFPGANVVNRGFGGSMLPDVIMAAPRIVLPLRPRLVVLYAGDNDLNAGRSPATVLADYRTFVALVRRELPAARILFVSIKPSPSRWAIVDRMREANRLVQEDVARDPLQSYTDLFTPMLGANGRPRPELFLSDSLHMTSAGYALWRANLSSLVR